MIATTVLIWTVAPSGVLISVRIPETGAGISASTLSVEISKSASSLCTASPAFLSHLVMVPSKMDSPICGITTSTPCGTCAGAEGPSCRHLRWGRLRHLRWGWLRLRRHLRCGGPRLRRLLC